ncbi:MAG: hypothetical protein ACERKR_06290, partial [Deltaproteobacteria bacterium]
NSRVLDMTATQASLPYLSMLHRQVVGELEDFCRSQGLEVGGVAESSLLGPKGNREFFIYAVKSQ